MDKVVISVGHYGPGTGASHNGHDEWTHARDDMVAMLRRIAVRNQVDAVPVCIDRRMQMWSGIDCALDDMGGLSERNHLIRACIARDHHPALFVELHYNSAPVKTAAGHEVFIDDDVSEGGPEDRLARRICDELSNTYPSHPNRGVKRARLKVLEMMRGTCPAVLIEPAFIFEPILDDPGWRVEYASAVARAVHKSL